MAATQMNVRMDAALKQAGDAVIAEYGRTPSQVVRAVWEYISLHRALPQAVDHMLRQDDLVHEAKRTDPSSEAQAGANIMAGFYTACGIEEPSYPPINYDVLRDTAAEEQLESWELL